MIIVNLKGGLGNQMFQYATAKALSLDLHKKLYIGLDFLKNNQTDSDSFTARKFSLNIFNFKKDFFNRSLPNYYFKSLYHSLFSKNNSPEKSIPTHFHYDDFSTLTNLQFPAFLDGYFQSEDYFLKYRDVILDEFTFQMPIGNENEVLLNEIKRNQSVSVHVRRGDYAYKPSIAAVHGTCSATYYENGVTFFDNKLSAPVFYIFSDDSSWVEQNLLTRFSAHKVILVNGNQGVDSWKDMFLMSNCRHHIIANSTFSWWGAWLNREPQKLVVAPREWFAEPAINKFSAEIVPKSWIRF